MLRIEFFRGPADTAWSLTPHIMAVNDSLPDDPAGAVFVERFLRTVRETTDRQEGLAPASAP